MRKIAPLLLNPLLLNFVILLSFRVHAHAEEPATATRPNIVFFIADDMQRYMFNCLDEGQQPYLTPNLDRLTASGTSFTRTYCQQALCHPSRRI